MQYLRLLCMAWLCITLTPVVQAEVLLHDSFGRTIPFSMLKGKWVVINYWAQWCPSCMQEIAQLNHFYKSHANDSVALFAVNYDGLSEASQKQLIKQFHIHYPNLLQDPAQGLHLGPIVALPATFIFNPQGKLIETLYGRQTARQLDRVLSSYRAVY